MKTSHFYSLFSTLILAICACGLISVEVSQDIKEVTIPGFDLPNAATVFPPMALNMDLKAELGAQETGPTSAAYLKEFSLFITNTAKNGPGDEDYFDFFSSINIHIVGATGTNLPDKTIAWIKELSPKATTLNFEIDDTFDLLPYIQQGAKFYSDIGGIQMPTDDISYAGKIAVTVKI